VIRLLVVFTIVLGLAAAETAIAQDLSTDDLVKALVPTKIMRGPRGVLIQSESKPPSIDLYIPFEYDSDILKTEALLTLKRLGAALRDPRLSGYRFKIAGHTDAKGSAEYNQKLPERRAEVVRNYVVFQFDIEPDRIEILRCFTISKVAMRRPNRFTRDRWPSGRNLLIQIILRSL
jgi:outer membrane protein OmpA-like peptidoglycan-associated protein